MVRFGEQEDALGVKGHRLVRGIYRLVAHIDDEVELAGFEFDGESGFDVRDEADFDVGEFATEVAKNDRQPVGEDAFRRADAERAAGLVTDGALALFHRGEGLFGEGLKTTPCICKCDAAAEAIEERNAEFLLEGFDLCGDVGLNGVNALGGTSEVEFLGESPEYLKLADFHRYLRNRWKSSYQSIRQIWKMNSESDHESRLGRDEKNATLASELNLMSLL